MMRIAIHSGGAKIEAAALGESGILMRTTRRRRFGAAIFMIAPEARAAVP